MPSVIPIRTNRVGSRGDLTKRLVLNANAAPTVAATAVTTMGDPLPDMTSTPITAPKPAAEDTPNR